MFIIVIDSVMIDKREKVIPTSIIGWKKKKRREKIGWRSDEMVYDEAISELRVANLSLGLDEKINWIDGRKIKWSAMCRFFIMLTHEEKEKKKRQWVYKKVCCAKWLAVKKVLKLFPVRFALNLQGRLFAFFFYCTNPRGREWTLVVLIKSRNFTELSERFFNERWNI